MSFWKKAAGVMLSVLLVWTAVIPMNLYAGEATEEKTVKVGYVNVPTYEEGGEGEYKTGSGYEYLQKISYYTGWKYEYVYGSFKELYDKLVTGEIDLFGNISYTEERAELFSFASYPQGRDMYFLYTTKDRDDLLNGDTSKLQGAKIGVTKDSFQESLLKTWLDQNQMHARIVEYDGYDSSMEALDSGVIDAIATPKLSSEKYPYTTIIDIGFSDYYFAVSKARPDLLAELNQALYEIQSNYPNYNSALETKYQANMISDTYINKKEQQWLDQHNNTMRLGYLKHNLPYSDQDEDGNLIGVLETLTVALDNNFGLRTEYMAYDNYMEFQDALETGEVDAIGPVYGDYWLAEQHNRIQTNAVVTTTPVLFLRNDNWGSFTDTVAVSSEGFFCADAVSTIFPDSEILTYDTMEDCLQAVMDGEAGCVIATASQTNLLKQYDKKNLLQIAELSHQIEVGICTAKENTELANIINKGISSAGGLLSGTVLTQNSYAEQNYTLRTYIEDHLLHFYAVILVAMAALVLLIIYQLHVNEMAKQANAAMKEALQAADEANRAKSTFLANMSHDIRTPINGIMGMLNMIDKYPQDQSRTRECLAKIRTSSEHLLQLINDVLDLSRLEAGQVVLEHVPFNLRKVCEEALAVVEPQAIEAGLQTKADHMDGTDVWLIGSPLHFKQVMLNLYTNAIKYNKPGGLLYTNLEAYNRTETTLTLKLTIQDTGIGMTQDFIDTKLFSPFIQEENGPRTKFKGTGLGMSIVQRIVEEMHGSIQVESKVGEGTTFSVYLPFEIDHSEHERPVEQEDEEGNIAGVHVLLVEDNELNMEIAEFILREAGAIVIKAYNGQEAVDLFKTSEEGSFDVILMDIMMPVLNGLDATRKIRNLQRKDASTIPIFAMTANAFSEDARKCMEAGMNEHIAKPVEPEKVVSLICRYVK